MLRNADDHNDDDDDDDKDLRICLTPLSRERLCDDFAVSLPAPPPPPTAHACDVIESVLVSGICRFRDAAQGPGAQLDCALQKKNKNVHNYCNNRSVALQASCMFY